MDIKIALSLCLIVLLGEKCLGWNLHFGYNHGGNSEYIHSNDTMRLTLEKNTLKMMLHVLFIYCLILTNSVVCFFINPLNSNSAE